VNIPPGVLRAKGVSLAARWTLAILWDATPVIEGHRGMVLSRVSASDIASRLGCSERAVRGHMASLATRALVVQLGDIVDVSKLGTVAMWKDAWDPGVPSLCTAGCSCESAREHCRCRVLVPLDLQGVPLFDLTPLVERRDRRLGKPGKPASASSPAPAPSPRPSSPSSELPPEPARAPEPAPEPVIVLDPAPGFALQPPPSHPDPAEQARKLLRVHEQFRQVADRSHGRLPSPWPRSPELLATATRAVSTHGKMRCMSALREHFERWQRDSSAGLAAPIDVWAAIAGPAPTPARSTALGGSGWSSHESWAAERERERDHDSH
jgi:hypothetical protein